MKSKLNLLLLVGCVVLAPIGFAQDNPVAATNASVVPATNEPVVAAPAVTNQAETAPATVTNVAATANPAPEPAPADTNQPAAPLTNPAPVVAPVAAPVVETNAPANVTNSNIIPLIQFVDVPLTAAIENLARQADLNYILDPKIGYGQPGPDGKPIAQPSISIRWENLTAEQALYAILNNYDLQLIQDSKTKIARVAPKDPTAPDPLVTKVIQLKYASPSNVLVSVQSTLPDKRGKVVADIRTS